MKNREDNVMREEWKDIEGYEGQYMVSNKGRVKSLDRIDYAGRQLKGKILKQAETRGNYLIATLSKEGKLKAHRVNRLVAIAFIDNHKGYDQAGHMDDDNQNNNVKNLYWTNSKENNTHNEKHKRCILKLSKRIVGVKGNESIIFSSSTEAGKNGFNASAIRNCISGLSNTHKGYKWEHC